MKKRLAQLIKSPPKNHENKKNNQRTMFKTAYFLISRITLVLPILLSMYSVPTVSAQDISEDVRIDRDSGIDEFDIQNPADLAFSQNGAVSHVLESSELTTPEQLISVKKHSTFDLENPASMILTPSDDRTDDPTIESLYVVNSASAITAAYPSSNLYMSENELQLQVDDLSTGRSVERSLNPIPQSTVAVPTISVTLVKTTNTYEYSPPSPDPSGLAYLSDSNKLIISDGEVNEIPAIFTGYNLFITTLLGELNSTLTTIFDPGPPIFFSDEPTGVAYNPSNKYLYFSDDNGSGVGIYECNPGSNSICDSGDTITFFGNVGSDPEGIAFDDSRGEGHLLVVDGANQELYDINLGQNGVLNSNDSVSHYDIGKQSSIKLTDPEGIEFNPDNNHLYILDRASKYIAETTINGTLIRYLDISVTNSLRPAGLTFAPASDGSGGKNLYIVDRGVDNGTDPNENDGRMYEVSVNHPPDVGAGPDQIISLPDSANLVGTVADDGLPDPPAQVTTIWSAEGIPPGTVTFGDKNALLTTASFSTDGVYSLRLTADDDELSAFDEVTITVEPPGNEPPTVDAGPDQMITLPDSAFLDGDVSDDGLPDPPGAVDTTWIKISGPGDVIITDPTAVDTTARFVEVGEYVLRLTAVDGGTSSAYDEVTITVDPVLLSDINVWLPVILSVTKNP